MDTTNKEKSNLEDDKKSDRELSNATGVTTTDRPPTKGAVPHNTVSDADKQNQQRHEGNRRADDKSQREEKPTEQNQRDSDPGNARKNPGQGETARPKTKTATRGN
jgi:hypothetical protein